MSRQNFHISSQGKWERVYNVYRHMCCIHIYSQEVAFVLYCKNYALVIFSEVSHIKNVGPCIHIRARTKYLPQSYSSGNPFI